MSQDCNIHHTKKIQITTNGYPAYPTIDLIIDHKNFDGSVTKLKLDIYADTWAELGSVLEELAQDCVKAIVIAKTIVATKPLATE